MTRVRLPDRRPSRTARVPVSLDGGREVHLLVTVGFRDEEMRVPAEFFCADFKAGTAMHAVVMDACVLMSRLLQHGTPPAELAAALSRPPSLVGSIAGAVAAMEGEEIKCQS